MERTPRRRRALSTALALLLAIESVTVVAAAARTSTAPRGPHALPEAVPAGLVLAESSADDPAAAAPVEPTPGARAPDAPVVRVPVVPVVPVAQTGPTAGGAAPPAPARASMPGRQARASTATPGGATKGGSGSAGSSGHSGSAGPAAHVGRNHVWIPDLGISRSVSLFPCERSRPPDNLVYRWGCAGANNVYLMGHAYSVFKPLHDAYVAGRLRAGMKAWYADAKGRVHVYAVSWWKTTVPSTEASWAWAAQARPSMTLQTCVGADSSHRLVVRLVEVDG